MSKYSRTGPVLYSTFVPRPPQHHEERPASVIIGDRIAQLMLLSGTDQNRLRLGDARPIQIQEREASIINKKFEGLWRSFLGPDRHQRRGYFCDVGLTALGSLMFSL